MKVTVILCTYNRCQILMKALESVAVSVMPESVEWEVLVVDNNSNDQTREVAQQICRKHPAHFRYLFEPRQGKSYALNSGIRVGRGDVLAFMDDDVMVDRSGCEISPRLSTTVSGPVSVGAFFLSGIFTATVDSSQ